MYQNQIKNVQSQLKVKCDAERKDFDEKTDAFYKDSNYDHLIIAQGEKWNYRLTSELGMDVLQNKIASMVNSIFGILDDPNASGKKEIDKTENGSVVLELSDEIKAALKLVSVYKQMASIAATNFIIGVMNLFSTSLNITSSHDYSAEALAPGLTLHIDVYSDMFDNEKFLNSDKIIENYIRFELIYSNKLALTTSSMNSITKLIGQISVNETKLIEFDNNIMNMACDMSVSMDTINTFYARSEWMHKMLQKFRDDMNQIIANQMISTAHSSEYSGNAVRAIRISPDRMDIQKKLPA